MSIDMILIRSMSLRHNLMRCGDNLPFFYQFVDLLIRSMVSASQSFGTPFLCELCFKHGRSVTRIPTCRVQREIF